jgi:hypothetical protein
MLRKYVDLIFVKGCILSLDTNVGCHLYAAWYMYFGPLTFAMRCVVLCGITKQNDDDIVSLFSNHLFMVCYGTHFLICLLFVSFSLRWSLVHHCEAIFHRLPVCSSML